jgi:hypothetical protein
LQASDAAPRSRCLEDRRKHHSAARDERRQQTHRAAQWCPLSVERGLTSQRAETDESRVRITPAHRGSPWRKPCGPNNATTRSRRQRGTKSSAYKAWRRALETVGVENRSLHSTRSTFISVARSNGADKDRVESITNNSSGSIIDDYTTWEWFALCSAVAVFDVLLRVRIEIEPF